VVSVAIPVLVYCAALFAVYVFLTRFIDPFHFWLIAGAVVVVIIGVALAMAGLSIGWCLLVLMLAPAIVVVGYETVGYRHAQQRDAAAAR
jgi:predicted tellurium resistance membrane protein TerC